MSDTPPVEDKAIRDKDNYRKMAEPFESIETAQNALEGFWDEFYALRNKHRIRDVYAIFSFAVKTPDGDGNVCTSMSAGNSARWEQMTAWAFAREKARHQAMLNQSMMADGQSVGQEIEQPQGEPK